MSNKEGRISVVISDNKRIPFVGKGPITRPIKILRSQYEILKKLGYKVREVDELVKKPAPEEKHTIEEVVINNEETTSEEEVVETIEEDEVEEALVEESAETEEVINEEDEAEEETNEDLIDSEEDVTEEEEIDIDTMTKREIKDELDKRGIEYNKNANLDKLKSLLMEGIEDEE